MDKTVELEARLFALEIVTAQTVAAIYKSNGTTAEQAEAMIERSELFFSLQGAPVPATSNPQEWEKALKTAISDLLRLATKCLQTMETPKPPGH